MYTHKNRNKDTLQIVLELLSFISSPSFPPPPPPFLDGNIHRGRGDETNSIGKGKGAEKKKEGEREWDERRRRR